MGNASLRAMIAWKLTITLTLGLDRLLGEAGGIQH